MVCFVILHYLVFDETKKSVESILKIKGNKKIIIVDNGSPNNSGEQLKTYFKNYSEIFVIINNENLGFANGNNIGYRYAKENFNPNFIVCLNNDVEIQQDNFIDLIKKININNDYYAISPDIYSTYSKIHQSPKRLKSLTIDDFRKELKKYEFRKNSKIFIPLKCLIKEFSFLKKIVQKYKFNKKEIDYNKIYENVPLHGACIIFTKNYINKMENAFFKGTFMYYELEILDYIMKKNQMKTIYFPKLKVLHHHSISSSNSLKSELKKEKFVNECVYHSISNFLDYIDKI